MSAPTSTRPRSLVSRLTRPSYGSLVFALVLVWGFGDLLSTLVAATVVGVGAEANPLVRTLLATDPLLLVALKMGAALSVGIVLLVCRSLVERVPLWRPWLTAVVCVGAFVVLSNFSVAVLAATA